MNTNYLRTGYTDSQSQTEARAVRMLNDWAVNFNLRNTSEYDALRIANSIDFAEEMDAEHVTTEAAPLDKELRLMDDTVDVSKYFGGIKATASNEWARRHLNEGTNITQAQADAIANYDDGMDDAIIGGLP